jgi:hypothetical protein
MVERCDFFGFADTAKPADPGALFYKTEHILEWQTATGFFQSGQRQEKGGDQIRNPNPGTNNEVNLCQFWERIWTGAHIPTFSLGAPRSSRTGVSWKDKLCGRICLVTNAH